MSTFLGSTYSDSNIPTLHFDSFRFIKVTPPLDESSSVVLRSGAHDLTIHCARLIDRSFRVHITGVRPFDLVIELIDAGKCSRAHINDSDSTSDVSTCRSVGDNFNIQLSLPDDIVRVPRTAKNSPLGAIVDDDGRPMRGAPCIEVPATPSVSALSLSVGNNFGAGTRCTLSMLATPRGVAALVAEGIDVARMFSSDGRYVCVLLVWLVADWSELARAEDGTFPFETGAAYDSLCLLRDASADVLPGDTFPIDQERLVTAVHNLHGVCMYECAALLMKYLNMQYLASLFVDHSYNNNPTYDEAHGTLGALIGLKHDVGARSLGNIGCAALKVAGVARVMVPEVSNPVPDDESNDAESSGPPGLTPDDGPVEDDECNSQALVDTSDDEFERPIGKSMKKQRARRSKRKMRDRDWRPRIKRSYKIEEDASD